MSIRPRVLPVLLLAALLPPGVAGAAAPVASTPSSAAPAAAPAAARLTACHRALVLDRRTAVVAAWMRPVPGATRLALRIELWQRTPGAPWTLRSDVPGLGAWIAPSDPLLGTRPRDVFKYRQAVGRLLAPATYRFRVAFRWSNAAGAVVRQASATTRACRQPDLRPDLVLHDVRVLPARGGSVRYLVRVGNDGRSAVARTTVAATFPGETTPNAHVRPVQRLAPGASVTIAFVGPGCAAGGTPATFVADPANAIDEANETNNELTATCPAP